MDSTSSISPCSPESAKTRNESCFPEAIPEAISEAVPCAVPKSLTPGFKTAEPKYEAYTPGEEMFFGPPQAVIDSTSEPHNEPYPKDRHIARYRTITSWLTSCLVIAILGIIIAAITASKVHCDSGRTQRSRVTQSTTTLTTTSTATMALFFHASTTYSRCTEDFEPEMCPYTTWVRVSTSLPHPIDPVT